MRTSLAALVLATSLIFCGAASAHDLDLTLIKVMREGNGARLEASTPLSRFVKSAGLSAKPTPAELDSAVRQRLGEGLPISSNLVVNTKSDLLVWSVVSETGIDPISRRFDESTPEASTLVQIFDEGGLVDQQILSSNESANGSLGMVWEGVNHILSGLDHILFVVGLALLGGSWRSIAKTLTAFTLAHTLTMAGSALGMVQGIPKIVEPLIALSIVFLAIEGLARSKQEAESPPSRNTWWRPAAAFGFGLVHGFGFAGGISDLGVTGASFYQNLALFSAGIELGQAMILALTLFAVKALMLIGRKKAAQAQVAASLALGMVGTFWFVERIL